MADRHPRRARSPHPDRTVPPRQEPEPPCCSGTGPEPRLDPPAAREPLFDSPACPAPSLRSASPPERLRDPVWPEPRWDPPDGAGVRLWSGVASSGRVWR